jgi:5-aminolevulinate synthase
MIKTSFADAAGRALEGIRAEGRYRTFVPLARQAGAFPAARLHGRTITVWCSNDYLGMGQHPVVLEAMHEALETYGAGAGGTRNISGTTQAHTNLEVELASLHCQESALLFTSGYVANEAALTSLGKLLPDTVIFSDAGNHASMIHGIRQAGVDKRIFRHNDVEHLEELLQQVGNRPKLIAVESVYSMTGSIAPLVEIVRLARHYEALLYVDEVHAVGLYGAEGGGIGQALGLDGQIDIVQGTLGKAYGLMGGYIAGRSVLVDYARSTAAPFIFTTAIPPVVAAGALASVQYLRRSGRERFIHRQRVLALKNALREAGVPFRDGDSHIIPVMIGDAVLCKKVSDTLLQKQGFYVQPINYPTVPRGTERLRVTVTPQHSEANIQELAHALGMLVGVKKTMAAA